MLNNSLNFMFSVIKQASMCGQSGVNFPTSKKCLRVLSVLYRSGFIRGFRYDENVTRVFLKYSTTSFKPVLKNISGISTNGRPFYISVKSLAKLAHASETFLVSTPYGVLTTTQALEKNVGGILLCKIF